MRPIGYILLLLSLFSIAPAGHCSVQTGTTTCKGRELGIYNLPPFERAILCTKFYEGWHGEERHLPYIGYGHKLLPGERLTHKISRAQGDSLLRADMRKLCRMFRRFGRDSVLLACLAYHVGPYRLLGSRKYPKSRLIRKLERGDRDIYKEYVSFRKWKGRIIPSIERRRRVEFALLYEP